MDERVQKYEQKMTKTLEGFEAGADHDPCRTCKSAYP